MAHRSRTGSVYLAVVVVVAAVTVLVMTGVALRKQINERAVVGADSAEVARLAVSASELAAHHAVKSETFEERAATGTIFSNLALAGGTISATVRDADTKGLPTEDTENFRITADAATGAARSRIAFTVETPTDEFTRWILSQPNAVAYWPLDEVNQTTAKDSVAERNGVYSRAFVAGSQMHEHGAPAPYFAWYDQFVRVPHRGVFELASGSLTFWVRFDVKPGSWYPGVMGAVSKERDGNSSAAFLAVYLDDDDLCYRLNNQNNHGDTLRTSSSRITAEAWHHIAVTWGNHGMELYLDGVRRDHESGARLGMGRNYMGLGPANTEDWYFGVRNIPYGSYSQGDPLVGSVARVALFSGRLSAEDIELIMKTSTMPPGRQIKPGSYARVVD